MRILDVGHARFPRNLPLVTCYQRPNLLVVTLRLSTAVGAGCADLVAPHNGRVQYYMSADSTLHANITCDDGYHLDAGDGSFHVQHILHCAGVIWTSSIPACTPGIVRYESPISGMIARVTRLKS